MNPFPIRLTTGLAALAACVLFSSCKSSQNSAYNSGVVDYTNNPNPKLSKEEYPFDDSGNYREDWAARGAGVSGVKDTPTDTALYSQNTDSGPINHPAYTPDDTPARTTFTSSSQGSSGSGSSAARRGTSSSASSRNTASKPHSTSASKPRTMTASRSGSGSSSSSSKSKPKTAAAKPKPKTTSKPASTTVKVKSSDTLYSLSKKHGVSVASIKAANGMKGDTLIDGKALKIPKKK